MYGAIIGDVAGSTYEFAGRKTKNFPLFPGGSDFADDTIMTVAVAKALMRSAETDEPFDEVLVEEMRILGEEYPHPKGGYGVRFREWLVDPFPMPYNGAGNGSAMRVSPCGLFAVILEEALDLAETSAAVTHSHPEGIKGARATAAVFLAKTGHTREKSGITSGRISIPWIRRWMRFVRIMNFSAAARAANPSLSRHSWKARIMKMP